MAAQSVASCAVVIVKSLNYRWHADQCSLETLQSCIHTICWIRMHRASCSCVAAANDLCSRRHRQL